MKAQKLYDLREKTEFTSGSDLSDFFLDETGEASPSGYIEIDSNAARRFVEQETAQMEMNNLGNQDIVRICQEAQRESSKW